MYFNRFVRIIHRSFLLVKSNLYLLTFGLVMALFGANFPELNFFQVHAIFQIAPFGFDMKVLYLAWNIVSFGGLLVVGAIFLPFLILTVASLEANGNKIRIHDIFHQALSKGFRYLILLFTYYIILFVFSGGGGLLTSLALIHNLFYRGIIVPFQGAILPIFISLGTIGIILSNVIALLFILASQILILEGGDVVSALIGSVRLLNKELPKILLAWILINVVMLIPLILLSSLLNMLVLLAGRSVLIQTIGFPLGVGLFLCIYTPVFVITNVYWTEIYLLLKGKLVINMGSGQ